MHCPTCHGNHIQFPPHPGLSQTWGTGALGKGINSIPHFLCKQTHASVKVWVSLLLFAPVVLKKIYLSKGRELANTFSPSWEEEVCLFVRKATPTMSLVTKYVSGRERRPISKRMSKTHSCGFVCGLSFHIGMAYIFSLSCACCKNYFL